MLSKTSIIVAFCLVAIAVFAGAYSDVDLKDEQGNNQMASVLAKLDSYGASMIIRLVFSTGNVEKREVYVPENSPQIVQYLHFLENRLANPPMMGIIDDLLDKINWEKVINYGKEAWKFIDDNKAVSDYNIHFANALPDGVVSPFYMEGWSKPMVKSYNFVIKNLLGVVVLDFTYSVTFLYNGSLGSKGNYLEHVGIIPTNVFVNWGWSLNADVVIGPTVNIGTTDSPIAAMTVDLHYKLHSLNSVERHDSFFVDGTGEFFFVNP